MARAPRREPHEHQRSDRAIAYPSPSLALLFVFLSSAATGVYGVIWTLFVAQVFGSSTQDVVGIILGAFLAALGLGSYVFGALADRWENNFRVYGFLQIGTGSYGIFFPLLFKLAAATFYFIFPSLSETNTAFFQLCLFALAFALLSIPGMLMGAMLPVSSRFLFAGSSPERGIGNLYAIHTLGAFSGCVLAGFHGIPALGMLATTYVATAANLAIALGVLVLERLGSWKTSCEEAETASDPPAKEPWADRLIIAAMALSGFTALVYGNSWTRVLTLVFGMSIYTWMANLAIFLIGLSAGSFFCVRLLGRKNVHFSTLGFVEFCIAATALAAVPLFEKLPLLLLRLLQGLGDSFSLYLTAQLLLSGMVMASPTVLLGMTFPLGVRLYNGNPHATGRRVGLSYAAQTAGAMMAALATASLLIPYLGIQNSLVFAGLCNLCIACALLVSERRMTLFSSLLWGGAIAALMIIVLSRMPPWDLHLLTSGVSIYGRDYGEMPNDSLRRELMRQDDILYYRESPRATISVHRDFPQGEEERERRYFRSNGRIHGSSHDNRVAQLLTGYLPLFFNPGATRAAVIGLNTGMTARAIAAFPLQRIDVLETEPAMLDAARFFDQSNGKVLEDRRVRLISSGARKHFSGAGESYDLIVSETAGSGTSFIGNRYTQEFYQLVKTKLSPRGVFTQYIDHYSMPPKDLRSVLRTFAEAFPHASLWQLSKNEFLLLGSVDAFRFDYPRLQAFFADHEGFRKDLKSLGLPDVYAVLGFHRMGRKEILAFTEGAGVYTDGGAQLAYSLPRNLQRASYGLNRQLMEPFVAQAPWLDSDVPIIPESLHRFYLAAAHAVAQDYVAALKDLELAIASDDENADFYVLKTSLLLRLGQEIPATQAALKALELAPSSGALLLSSSRSFRVREARGLLFKKIIERGVQDIRPYIGMAEIGLFFDSLPDAETWAERAKEIQPEHPKVLEISGRIEALQGNFTAATNLLERAKNKGADSAVLYGSLGDAYAATESWKLAETAYEQALKRDLRNVRWRRSLGLVLARMGKRAEAERTLRETLALDPADADSWRALDGLVRRPRSANGKGLAYGGMEDGP